MPDDALMFNTRIIAHQSLRNANKPVVLSWVVRICIRTLKLNADGKFIAPLLSLKARSARVPRTQIEGYKLKQSSIAPNQEMGRDLQVSNGLEEGMRFTGQAIGEELFYMGPTIFSRGQADIM